MEVSFFENLGKVIPADQIDQREGFSYLNWARAVRIAGHPQGLQVGRYGPRGTPYVPMLGGLAVGLTVPLASGQVQTTWLPVLGPSNKPIVDAKELADAINRGRAKAIACTYGVGLTLYAGYDGDGPRYLKDLALTPASDLEQAAPLVAKRKGRGGEASYLDWSAALAAAKITDPDFHWEVEEFGTTEDGYPQLYCPVGDAHALVGVSLTYKGIRHTEFLGIMDSNNKAVRNPDVFDWNKAVMRCLTKAIALVTGYGYGLYSKEEVVDSREVAAQNERQAARVTALLTGNQPYPGFAEHVQGLPGTDILFLGKVFGALGTEATAERKTKAIQYVQGVEDQLLSTEGKQRAVGMFEQLAVAGSSAEAQGSLLDTSEDSSVDTAVSDSTKASILSALAKGSVSAERLANAGKYARQKHAEQQLTDDALAEVLAVLEGHRLALAEKAAAAVKAAA